MKSISQTWLKVSKENHPLHQENRRFFRCYWKYFEFWEIKMRKTQVSDMARNGQEWFSEKFEWRVIFWHGNKETIFVGNFCHVWEIDFTPKAQDRITLMIKIDLTNCSFICKNQYMIAINNRSLIRHGLLVLLAVLPEGFYWWSLARYGQRTML